MTKEEAVKILVRRIKAIDANFFDHREEALQAIALAIKTLNELEPLK